MDSATDRSELDQVPAAAERFPFTKFLPPAVDGSVDGARVTRLARAIDEHRVVLVRAPAGSGKTTLLAAWAARAPTPVAWLRVDAGDDGAEVFALALHTAVAHVDLPLGQRVPGLLAGRGAARDPRSLAVAFVNDLSDAPAFVVALDDLHAIGSGAASFLALLVDLLPPHVRVLAASRSAAPLPVARLRVRGELGELAAADLRLGLDEVRRVLARRGPSDDASAERVLAMSGGWAAAVRLAAASIPMGTAAVERGDQRAGDEPGDRVRAELWDYLAEEVLHEQPPELRTFLLETSVLAELLPQTCAAVTGRTDAADVLAELETRDLFIARFHLDGGDAWRYHDLFADFLRERLRRERGASAVAELHRRAAAVLPPLAALPHLVAAGDGEAAADRIAEAAFSTFDGSMIPHLVAWIDRLPPAIGERDPRLVIVRAWYADILGRSREARAAVEPLWRHLVAAGRHDEATDLGLQLLSSLLTLGDMGATDEVLHHLEQRELDAPRRVVVLVSRMWREWNRRDATALVTMLEAALDLSLRAPEGSAANVLAPSLTSPLLFLARSPAWLLDSVRQLDARLAPHDGTARLQLRTLTAAAALLDLDLTGAEAELRSVLTTSEALGRITWTHQDAEALLLALLLVKGERATVVQAVDAAAEARASSPVYERLWPAYAYAALRAASPGRDARALRTLTARYLPDSLQGASPNDAIVRGLSAAWLAVATGSAPDGREPLAALAAAEAVQSAACAWLGFGLPGLERASLLLEAGRATAALDAAEPTLDAAARYGAGILLTEAEAHRPLLMRCAAAGLHADLIAAAFTAVDAAGAAAALVIPGSSETLTVREVDVLRLVAAGRANRDIATELGIAEATVKTHMTRLLGKLGATSRTHAVARARELYLL